MNLEVNRLRSFDAWPANTPVTPQDLARFGFYATGNFLEAECQWCRCRISSWNYGDEVEQRHRSAAPQCPFFVNRLFCGNVPLAFTTAAAARGASPPAATSSAAEAAAPPAVDLFVEANRLATFTDWPNPNISPQSLAKAGFFYLHRTDQVQCAWCKGIIAKWEKHDNAFDEHQRLFPDCPRVQLGPLIEMTSDGIRDLGIQKISAPKKTKFASLDARLRTFHDWPISDIVRPEALAQAGLFYQSQNDFVRCFHCNIGLRSWQKEDDPWFEHAKWYPQCQFVLLVKGHAYVQRVQELSRQSAQQQPLAPPPVCPSMSIEEAMSTPPVLQALEIGIDGGSIRNATQRQLQITGRPYGTVEDLVKAVFDGRADEDPSESQQSGERGEDADTDGNGDDSAGALIVREVSRIINSIFNATDNEQQNTTEESASSQSQHQSPISSTLPDLCQTEGMSGGAAAAAAQVPNVIPTAPLRPLPAAVPTAEINDSLCAASVPVISAQPSPPFVRSLSLEEENRKLKDARQCKVCLDEEVGVVFLPCGHLVTCVQCAPGVSQCPMCRTTIKGFVRTFLS